MQNAFLPSEAAGAADCARINHQSTVGGSRGRGLCAKQLLRHYLILNNIYCWFSNIQFHMFWGPMCFYVLLLATQSCIFTIYLRGHLWFVLSTWSDRQETFGDTKYTERPTLRHYRTDVFAIAQARDRTATALPLFCDPHNSTSRESFHFFFGEFTRAIQTSLAIASINQEAIQRVKEQG